MEVSYISLVSSLLVDDMVDLNDINENTTEDFLSIPTVEFIPRDAQRDRAFSWDLAFESKLEPELSAPRTFSLPLRKRTFSEDITENFCQTDYLSLNPSVSETLFSSDFSTAHTSMFSNMNTMKSNVSDALVNICDPVYMMESNKTEGRVGTYTKEERKMIIEKFRAKKQRRVWRKTIKYDCRKRLADTRPRVKGRFISRDEEAEDNCDASTLHNVMSRSENEIEYVNESSFNSYSTIMDHTPY